MKRAIFHYSINEIAPYIDWSYFLHAWGVKAGAECKETADELLRDAKAMLGTLDGKYSTHALFALCDAAGSGDNIMIEGVTLPLLRQQHARQGEPNLCLSDFVSPHGDSIGLFAATVDSAFGAEYSNDEYQSIMAQTLADRLAEATAARLHLAVRTHKELWGYAPHEKLTIEELHREANQGIRPAVGYPSLPDQSIIFIIDTVLKTGEIGITLTPNGAMQPHAAVCGLMIQHPAARYFAVGEISEEQLDDYSARRGVPAKEIKRFLSRNLEKQAVL